MGGSSSGFSSSPSDTIPRPVECARALEIQRYGCGAYLTLVRKAKSFRSGGKSSNAFCPEMTTFDILQYTLHLVRFVVTSFSHPCRAKSPTYMQ